MEICELLTERKGQNVPCRYEDGFDFVTGWGGGCVKGKGTATCIRFPLL